MILLISPLILILHGEKTMKTSKNSSHNSLRFITLLVLSSVSLHSFTAIAQTDPKTINADKEEIINAYKEALTDSIKTEPDEITNNLKIIDNPQANSNFYWDKQGRVLVVTFTNYSKFKDKLSANAGNLDGTWVTVVPKLKSFCTNHKNQNPDAKIAELNLRIEQLLGIIPDSKKTHVVEIWVDPNLLHRPNNSVNISKSEKESFLSWLKDNPWRYQTELVRDLQQGKSSSELAAKHYPWTGLGYSFDWSSKLNPSIKEFGLSEFVIWGTKEQLPSSGKVPPVEVNRVFTTEKYCKPDNSL
jgi:hypothetical protein